MADTINLTVDDAMAAVFAEFGSPEIDLETEFTEGMFASANNLSEQSAYSLMGEALKAGRVTRHRARHNGRRVWAYSLVTTNKE